ncbi:MAG: hypothetical protein EU532_08000 [Promethearchaeota archaeon]|nr:MAG: hypothetical protein EU532_08000 [Candidatus Lokiarchaeota archaeon]
MFYREFYISNNKSLNRVSSLLTTNSIDLIVDKLSNSDQEVIDILDRFIRIGISLIHTTEELREEILDFDELYQFYFSDINFNFWIKISQGKVTYKKGYNENNSLRIYFTRDLIVKIFKEEIGGTEAYMKGLLKIHGNLSHAFKIKKFLRLLIEYLKAISTN